MSKPFEARPTFFSKSKNDRSAFLWSPADGFSRVDQFEIKPMEDSLKLIVVFKHQDVCLLSLKNKNLQKIEVINVTLLLEMFYRGRTFGEWDQTQFKDIDMKELVHSLKIKSLLKI